MKSIRAILLTFAILAVVAHARAQGVHGNLVDTRWLARNLDSPEVLVLDAQPRQLHSRAHVPGAVPVDVMMFMLASFSGRDMQVQEMERMYQAVGIDPAKKIVIYDQGGTWFAPRLFFQLVYHGFPAEKLAILDGGLAKWQADGHPVTKDATPAPKAGGFKVTRVNEQERTRPAELVTASGDRKANVLVDAMGTDNHYGSGAFGMGGHIPYAVSMPAEDFYNADKTFKSPEEIRRMATLFGIRPDQEIHAHCGGGGAAAVPYFALKHLAGHSKVKLSVESQMGWLRDDRALPFWTYGAPAMMRDADWLPAWGGRMMRMYGVSKVSVVDVRAPAAYAQGHIPFALNVPGESFRSHAGDPQKLAEVLGASGVDPSHEAVIVSGGGVTKDAALAYVALERLGQKKVSIFMDSLESVESLDKMARANFGLTKEATIVGKPAKPTDMAVPPAKYTPTLKDGVTLSDARAGGGAYPKIFIASGKALPSRAIDGKVVHVPYTDLLKPDGTPKDAKDIWTILSKAGVPRYAEVVSFSDDPGEAAANYFILKLMGYPDVKVLLG
jgi:thiosulfate/3-mercaptopyruvate sulfurtransferase